MKKGVITVVVIVIIALIILFFLKGCEPRVKTEGDEAAHTEDTRPIKDYRDAFIEANTEFTCALVKNPELTKDGEKMKTILDEAYERNTFPIEDNARMLEILAAYENDEEVIGIIKGRVEACQKAE